MTGRKFIPILLIASTLITFAPLVTHDFVLQDDPETIAENPRINPPSMEGVLYYWQNPAAGLYVPLTYTYWSAIASISRSPALFHAASVIIHLVNVLLVYGILHLILKSERSAFVGAMLFGLHPLQVETVAWASGAKDLLAGFFSLLMSVLYLQSISGKQRRYGFAIAALIAGMLCKPSAIVAPFIAGAIDVLLIRMDWRAAARSLWPFVALTIPCIIWSRMIQTIWSSTVTPLWMRPFIAGDAIAFYLYKLVWPISLTNLYGRTPQAIEASGWLYISWIIPVLIGLLIMFSRKLALTTGAVILFIALLPVLGFTPFMFQLYSTVADHYMYLPMLGAGLFIGAITSMYARNWIAGVCALLLVAFSVRSVLQMQYWRDSISLYSHAVELNPSNLTAHGALANSFARAGRFDEAAGQFQLLVNANPLDPLAQVQLGRALDAAGRPQEAEPHLAAAVKLQPDDPGVAAELASLRRRLATPSTNQ